MFKPIIHFKGPNAIRLSGAVCTAASPEVSLFLSRYLSINVELLGDVQCAMCIYMCIRQSSMMFQSLVRMPCIELQSVTVFVSALACNRFSTFVSIKVAPIFSIPKWIACALALITTNSPPDYPEFVGISAVFSCVTLCLIFKLKIYTYI